ncbi:MAG: ABC transporter substrate-binding protein [Planctomycetes bacterium]|nr:ABC transporter substrate-binding protein [Planctomycetota bacterium]MBI3835327.1 ABC transporter substrate-binding protein [Planctomycetota bacterium]
MKDHDTKQTISVTPNSPTTTRTLTLGHSPDPDDAFMFYALAKGRIDTGAWRFEHVLQDIQTLNERAMRGELDITAISIHAYPFVADRYALTACGCSMGDGYGPMIVAREPMAIEALRGKTIAVPGERTTAFLALNLLLGRSSFRHSVVMFDQILSHVELGQADAGLIIHEGQLTYSRHKLHKIVDLGAWWKESTSLPLPLGGNCIRRDLGNSAMTDVTRILRQSIEYSLAHRSEAVDHALAYARDMGKELADRFVGMYVNDWTLDYGEIGRKAVRELLRRGHEIGMVPKLNNIEFIS